jgi:hypothetical protein
MVGSCCFDSRNCAIVRTPFRSESRGIEESSRVNGSRSQVGVFEWSNEVKFGRILDNEYLCQITLRIAIRFQVFLIPTLPYHSGRLGESRIECEVRDGANEIDVKPST